MIKIFLHAIEQCLYDWRNFKQILHVNSPTPKQYGQKLLTSGKRKKSRWQVKSTDKVSVQRGRRKVI